jgi:hypothetical protein
VSDTKRLRHRGPIHYAFVPYVPWHGTPLKHTLSNVYTVVYEAETDEDFRAKAEVMEKIFIELKRHLSYKFCATAAVPAIIKKNK